LLADNVLQCFDYRWTKAPYVYLLAPVILTEMCEPGGRFQILLLHGPVIFHGCLTADFCSYRPNGRTQMGRLQRHLTSALLDYWRRLIRRKNRLVTGRVNAGENTASRSVQCRISTALENNSPSQENSKVRIRYLLCSLPNIVIIFDLLLDVDCVSESRFL